MDFSAVSETQIHACLSADRLVHDEEEVICPGFLLPEAGGTAVVLNFDDIFLQDKS
ncbi:MAG: hypothetical protein AB1632_12465 [Nitrospirota bacterium]